MSGLKSLRNPFVTAFSNFHDYEEVLIEDSTPVHFLHVPVTKHDRETEKYPKGYLGYHGYTSMYSITEDGKYILMTYSFCHEKEKRFERKLGRESCINNITDDRCVVLSNTILRNHSLFRAMFSPYSKFTPSWLDITDYVRNELIQEVMDNIRFRCGLNKVFYSEWSRNDIVLKPIEFCGYNFRTVEIIEEGEN